MLPLITTIASLLQNKATRSPFQLAIVSGLLLGLSFPPFVFPFLSLIAWIPMLYVLEEHRNGKYYRYLYSALLIWNLIGCYWLMFIMLEAGSIAELIQHFMAGFLAITLNPLLQSIPVWIAVRLRNRTQLGWWALIPLFVAFEHLHLNWELTWSWMTLGHAWANFPLYVQYIEWTGVLGASAFILVTNLWLYAILQKKYSFSWALIVFLLFPFLLDIWFLYPQRSIYQTNQWLYARIIQPNIDPYEKFDPASEQKQIETFYKLSTQNLPDSTSLVIFPETAIPHLIRNTEVMEDPALKPIIEAFQRKNMDLLTGVSEYKIFESGNQPIGAKKYDQHYYQSYNAALMVKKSGYRFYEKAKLVPFVERTPYLEQLQFLQYFNMDLGGSFGNYGFPDSLYCLEDSKKNKIASVICYESIFGSHVRKFVDKGANVLAILTNDGWWKQTSGYIQHAHYARLRALETRRAILRSANTGRSFVCYPTGAVSDETSYNAAAYIDTKIPILTEKTIYVQWGDWFAYICMIFACFGLVLAFSQKNKTIKNSTLQQND